ncbi:MAG: heavy metal translocating P-type ATPase [Spirochaetes bacterium]|nr:MAG: heavy metal translocating P-type ATPase [Spirochaetota bacterium]
MNRQSEIDLKIGGMSCVMCARTVENALTGLDGVETAEVNHATGSARVKFARDPLGLDIMRKAIHEAGYEVLGSADEDSSGAEDAWRERDLRGKRNRFIAGIAGGFVLMGLMYLPELFPVPLHLALLALSLPLFVYTAAPIFLAAWRALRNRNLSMDVMYAMGIGTAYGASILGALGVLPHHFMFYETAVMLAGFLMLGRYLESRARGRTSDTIRKLIALNPETALLESDGAEREIPLGEVRIGDILVVKPGARVPADGTVMGGESFVNESMLTGEPVPVRKAEGSRVTGGTLNTNGVLRVRAERVGEETVLAQIVRLVRHAQGSRPPVQRIADSVVGWFIPVILTVAVLAFASWYFLAGESLLFSFTAFVSILVIACPCALGLATPTAVTVGIGRAAELGILVRDGETLEKASGTTDVLFDKTGTLTQGHPSIVETLPFGTDEADLLACAAAAEKNSEHPLAGAVMRHVQSRGIAVPPVDSFGAVAGQGVRAVLDGQAILAGSPAYIEREGIVLPGAAREAVVRMEDRGATVIAVAHGGRVLGLLGVADRIRESAAPAVRALKEMNISVHMITGDNERTAMAVARETGIETIIAGVLPGDKAAEVERLRGAGRSTAFAGDGINDAPALASAGVGIALSGGTDIAVESGDIVLMKNDLRDVPAALELGRAVMARIRVNIFWAFAYNMLLVPVAAGALHPLFGISFRPELAGLAMAMSSVTVVSMSLLLKRFVPNVYGKGRAT